MKKTAIRYVSTLCVALAASLPAFAAESLLRSDLAAAGIDPASARAVPLRFTRTGPLDITDIPVDDAELPFTEAQRIVTRQRTERPWGAHVKWFGAEAVNKGDVILVQYWLRSVPLRDGLDTRPSAAFYLKEGQARGRNLARGRQALEGEWVRTLRHAVMQHDTDDWWLEFHLGAKSQELDLAGLTVLNLGPDVDTEKLPRTTISLEYEGREADAAWRKAARERIRELRMSDLTLRVVDADGNPVPNAQVEIAMTRHAFPFGTAVAAPMLVDSGGNPESNQVYREKLLEYFNMVTIQNALKAPAWRGSWSASLNREHTLRAFDWLEEQGMPIRGHTLLWSTFGYVGVTADDDFETIDRAITENIRSKLGELRGRIVDWDMHNHPIAFPAVWMHIGREHLLRYWALARELEPDARMSINEGGILPGAGRQLEAYEEHIAWLLENEAPVEAIGFMGHFSAGSVIPPEEILAKFDRFARFGLPLFISEFDISVDRNDPDEVALQADFTRDFLIACFSHPSVDTFISWNFWEGRHWKPSAAYYNMDWSLRPNGEAYMDLVFGEWWTEETGATADNGLVEFRGFLGDYKATVAVAGSEHSFDISLDRDMEKPMTLVVEIPPTE